jgi:hypothetical protein
VVHYRVIICCSGNSHFSTGSYSLAEVASELDRETLRRLKRECGGLQTLLRNSHQVFKGKGLSYEHRSPCCPV